MSSHNSALFVSETCCFVLSVFGSWARYRFCNFNDMRDVFWPSIMPFTKAEMMSKGLLTSSGADAPKKDKDEWVMCMNEGQGCVGTYFITI